MAGSRQYISKEGETKQAKAIPDVGGKGEGAPVLERLNGEIVRLEAWRYLASGDASHRIRVLGWTYTPHLNSGDRSGAGQPDDRELWWS